MMWPFNQPAPGAVLILKISGMHCASCALNIDNTLEDFPGVISSQTNYARGITRVTYQPGTDVKKFSAAVKKLGYSVTI